MIASEPARSDAGAVTTRIARPGDARTVSRLYRESYTPTDGGDAGDHYPFPQLLEPALMAERLADPGHCWMVAEASDEVVGVVGAKRNIGGPEDRITEFVGLVVDPRCRRLGIATRLMAAFCATVEEDSRVMLAETRTATSGGWRSLRRCGFLPIGFEPFAHATPAGLEPMLLLGRVQGVEPTGPVPAPSAALEAVGRSVLGAFGLAVPVRLAVPAAVDGRPADGSDSIVVREAGAAPGALGVVAAAPGVVGLHRLEGMDPRGRRYEERWFVARRGDRACGSSRVVVDRRDRRARIAETVADSARSRDALLAYVVRSLREHARNGALTVVVDVRVDRDDVQCLLESFGFFPTTYYPQLLLEGGVPVDVAQFTCLLNQRFDDSLAWTAELDWTPARVLIESITRSARCS